MELPSALLRPSYCSSLSLLALFFAVFFLCFDFMKRRKRWKGYPPGPPSLPFLGNMLQVDFSDPAASFEKLRKKYGNVFSLQFCWTNVVVLNEFEVMKEALVNKSEDIADRPPFPIYEHLGFQKHSEGVVVARYGRAWKEQRRFSLSTLRNFGLGKKSLEERIREEAGFLCSAFAAEEGKGDIASDNYVESSTSRGPWAIKRENPILLQVTISAVNTVHEENEEELLEKFRRRRQQMRRRTLQDNGQDLFTTGQQSSSKIKSED